MRSLILCLFLAGVAHAQEINLTNDMRELRYCATPRTFDSMPIICIKKSAYDCPGDKEKALRKFMRELVAGMLRSQYHGDELRLFLHDYRYGWK